MEYTTYLFACAARGEKAQPPRKEVDWNRIVSIAVEQSITYTVALAIKNGDLGCPNDIKNRLTSSLRGAAIKNSIRTEGILTLVDKMNKAGIKTAIIKGIDAARFYANPECRVSSDADLLISPDDEDRTSDFLREYGFKMKERGSKSHHAEGDHPTLGMVELHVSLVPEIYHKTVFSEWPLNDSALDRSIETELDGKRYYSLEPTDNLLFLTQHMLKHLIFNGISLRMIMDNALFAKHNLAKIDRAAYEAALKSSRHYYTMQLLFGAMVLYGGFSEDDFPIEPKLDREIIEEIFTDLEKSGWQGFNEGYGGGERVEAWTYYVYKTGRDSGDKAQVREIERYSTSSNFRLLFPSMKTMQRKYPKLTQHPQLYPYYWTHRFFTKGMTRFFGGNLPLAHTNKAERDLPPAAKDKIKLFKKLKIM